MIGGSLGAASVVAAGGGVAVEVDPKAWSNENGLDSLKAWTNEKGLVSGTGGRTGRPSTPGAGRAGPGVLCCGLNAFSKPESRAVVVRGFTAPLVLGGGGNAVELEGDTPSAGREAVVSALAKSNWSSNVLSKERSPAAVDAVLGKSPNALSKSLTVAAFGVSVSEDAVNGEVETAKGLVSFAGIGGKGLVLWTSTEGATPVTGGNGVSAVVWGKV